MKILLGICGSIAAYKSYDLCRSLVNDGHEVRIVLTQGALQFIKPEVFHYLGAERVFLHNQDFIDPEQLPLANSVQEKGQRGTVLHISLSNWCDRLVIAPLSAHTLSRLARGEANDLLSSIFLSLGPKPIVLFPAMNTRMFQHPLTQENLGRLKKVPTLFIYPPDAGKLACGDIGEGKFPPLDAVIPAALTYCPPLAVENPAGYSGLTGPKTVLISAGATMAPLDPIRYLTNPSSGKTALALTQKFLQEGHTVIVVAGLHSAKLFAPFLPFPQFRMQEVITTKDMEREVLKYFPQSDIYLSTAAICDMEFLPSREKMKKEEFAEKGNLPFKKAVDILAEVLALRTPEQKVIGFAAETNPSPDILYEKWNRKKVDLLVGNKVDSGLLPDLSHGQLAQGFGTDEGHYFFVKNGKIDEEKRLSKSELAREIYRKTILEQY